MPTCPNGHQSGSEDWCEVCGHRMAGAVPPPPPPPPPGGYGFPPPAGQGAPAGRQPEFCPQCRTPREGAAPFCEECRWNFLTNTATSYTPAATRPPGGGPPPSFQTGPTYGGGPDSYDYQGSRPSQVNRPAEPIPPGGPYGDPAGQRPGPPGAPGGPGMPGGPGGPGGPGAGPGQGPGGPFGGPGGHGGPPGPGGPFGGDPSRSPVPPPPGPAVTGGVPSAFQQPGPPGPPAPPASPGFPRQPAGGPQFGGGEDDWVISPPSTGPGGHGGHGGHGSPGGHGNPGAHGGPGGPAGPGGPVGGGGYGYPQPGATQAPPAPQRPMTWTATIGPDRDYFLAMMQRSGPEAAGLNLPAYSPEQQRALTGNQITIGRRRHSTGETPDIDLSVPPEDPGVSHAHAMLVQQPDGTWAVVDQNSTNGTTVNGSEEPIQPFVPVPLQDGDRVHVGAWTTITVRRG
ncbi:FHA domain-containing protein [Streptomyces sp. NPDC091377]|uniref:FHA domain-containing protein n=1 Tax=Streptomyces sp. NPDC091377 TaxID=3365995 RepID=UPI003820B576